MKAEADSIEIVPVSGCLVATRSVSWVNSVEENGEPNKLAGPDDPQPVPFQSGLILREQSSTIFGTAII
jgi:hypothetical protein